MDGLLEKLPAQKVNATKYTNTTIMTERSAVVKPSRQLLTTATLLFNKVVHGADLTFRANLKWLLEELQFLALMHFYICF